jgi:hypothetical protein
MNIFGSNGCITVSQFITRPHARQFEQNTEARLSHLEAENTARAESPLGVREQFECQRDERGGILSYSREISGEEIAKESKVNYKVS